MSEIVHVIAVLSPAPGKEDVLREALTSMTKSVHSNEEHALRYLHTEQIGGDGPADVIMIETYKDQATRDKHDKTEHFKTLFEKLQGEQLLAKHPYIVTTKSKSGYDIDRNLI